MGKLRVSSLFLAAVWICGVSHLLAADAPREAPARTFNDIELREEAVNNHCRELYTNIKKISDKPEEISDAVAAAAVWYRLYANHPDIEMATGIRRRWYQDVVGIMDKICDISNRIGDIYADRLQEDIPELRRLLAEREPMLKALDNLVAARSKFRLSAEERRDLADKRRDEERRKRDAERATRGGGRQR